MSADRPRRTCRADQHVWQGQSRDLCRITRFATASEHALVEDRVLFRNLFRMLETERRIKIEAPSNVEAVVTDDPESRTLRVHLLAYNPTPRTTPLEKTDLMSFQE